MKLFTLTIALMLIAATGFAQPNHGGYGGRGGAMNHGYGYHGDIRGGGYGARGTFYGYGGRGGYVDRGYVHAGYGGYAPAYYGRPVYGPRYGYGYAVPAPYYRPIYRPYYGHRRW